MVSNEFRVRMTEEQWLSLKMEMLDLLVTRRSEWIYTGGHHRDYRG